MFNFFKSSDKPGKPELPIPTDQKKWIEEYVLWLGQCFGFDRLRTTGFITPTEENFPKGVITPESKIFEQIFFQFCEVYELNPNEITLRFFEDRKWTTWAPKGELETVAGTYSEEFTESEKRFIISLDKNLFNNVNYIFTVLAHELAHVKLLGGRYLERNHPDMEPLTDLATVFFGFGIYTANSCIGVGYSGYAGSNGYLNPECIAYAMATINWIREVKEPDISLHLNSNCNELFQKSLSWMWETKDTLLTREKIEEIDHDYQLISGINKAFDDKNYNRALELSHQLFKGTPADVGAYNSRGYAQLMLKNYDEAIQDFNAAIDLDQYWDYPFNNRGYCYLMLGQLEEGFIDCDSSFQMNPDNSYSHRNLGIYYLLTANYTKAKEYLETALKLDPKTDLIYYYVGMVNLKMGNNDAAKLAFEKSAQLNEPEGLLELEKMHF